MFSTLAQSVGLILLASSTVSAQQCIQDPCLSAFIAAPVVGLAFCLNLPLNTQVLPSPIPEALNACDGVVAALNSACACVSATATAGPSSGVPSNSANSTATATGSTGPMGPSSGVPSNSANATSTASSTDMGPTASSTDMGPSSGMPTNSANSSSSTQYTTSTVQTTSLITVTSCAPTVTNCPAGPHVETVTIDLYTTVCPVSQSSMIVGPPAMTSTMYSTSTVYTTTVYTITSCAPTVTNCPVGQTTTAVVPAYTTTYAVTASPSGSPAASNNGTNPMGPSFVSPMFPGTKSPSASASKPATTSPLTTNSGALFGAKSLISLLAVGMAVVFAM